jgi:predicted dehydrogenase
MKVGMIGVGGFGGYRRDRMRESGLFHVAACYDRNAQTLEKAAREENGKACASVEEVIATPGIEGVVISTGGDTHVPFAVKAMRAGLHVFIEKPLCGRPEEVDEILRVRKETNRVVGMGHNFNPNDSVITLVQQTIASGKLGTVACYEENSSHSGGLEIKPGDWRGIREKNPGGMLLQCGVHALHGLLYLFGPLDSVACMMRYDAHPGTQTADVANVLLRHTSGLVGTLNCYHVTGYCHEFRIFGTAGNLYIDTNTRKAFYQQRKRGELEPREPVALPEAPADHKYANVVSWHQAIRKGTKACPSLEDGIAAVEAVFAADTANERGSTVKVRNAAGVGNG